jgi:hypothetical protein
MNSTWAWRLPSALQGGFSIAALLIIPFIPESPRWLVAKDRRSEALDILALTHSDGNKEDPVVMAVYKEIVDTLEFEAQRGKGISYVDALKSKQTLRRIALMTSVAVITMMSGIIAPESMTFTNQLSI